MYIYICIYIYLYVCMYTCLNICICLYLGTAEFRYFVEVAVPDGTGNEVRNISI